MSAFEEFRSGSSCPNRSYLSSNTLLLQDTSLYHEQCIPTEVRDRVKSAPPRSRNVRDYQICNHVAEERIWDERVRKERSLQKQWDTKYSFLTKYDQYGNPREPKKVPIEKSFYASKKRPLTAGREYGHRVNSAPAKTMSQLQMQMKKGETVAWGISNRSS